MPGEIHTRVNNTVTAMLPDDDKKYGDPKFYAVTTTEHAHELQKVYIVVDYDKFNEIKKSPLLELARHQQDRVFTVVKLNHATIETVQFDPTMPIFCYTRDYSIMQRLIDTGKVGSENVYNPPADRSITSDKLKFHQTYGDAEWLPKTVFSREDAAELAYPVICKPKHGSSGVGIEKIESHDELMAHEGTFDVYSECVDIDTEFRAFCFKGDVLLINERVPETGKDGLSSRTPNKHGEKKIRFVYGDVDLEKFEQLDQVKSILSQVRDKCKLDVLAIDLIRDTDGKLWVVEMNARPGMHIEKMALLYTSIYADWYKKEVSESTQQKLDEMIDEYKKLKEKSEAASKLKNANEGLRHVLTFESFVAKHYGRS